MLHSERRDQVAVLTLDEASARGFLDEVGAAEALLETASTRAAALAALATAACAGIERRRRAPTAHLTAGSPGIELNVDLGIRGA